MNPTLKALAQVCKEKRTEEKLLFTPSYSVGHQLGEALSRAGVPWLNLRTVPVAAHAEERALPEMAARGMRRIDPHEQLLLVERLFLEDPVLSVGYFAGAASPPGVVRALWQSICELRMAGLGPEDMRVEAFVVPGKGEAVQRLLGAYERALEDEWLVDEAGLLCVALGVEEDGATEGGSVVMALAGMARHPLEKRYVKQVAKGALRVLGQQRVPGLARPGRLLEGQEAGSGGSPPSMDLDRLRWLWAPEEAPPALGDGSVSLFHAAGESNEVREVLRRVLTQGVLLDEVEVLFTREEPYASLFLGLAWSLDLPVTSGGGIPISHTRPGRAVRFFLEWQKEDFLQRPLMRLLAGGYLDFARAGILGEVPSFGRAAALVRKAGIGWGRERWAKCLEALEGDYRARAEALVEEGEQELAQGALAEAAQAAWVGQLVRELLALAPEAVEGEAPSLGAICKGLVGFLERFSRAASGEDGEARSRLIELLETLGRVPAASGAGGWMAWLEKALEGLRVGASSPRPGHLHVGSYAQGGHSGRKNTFVVGLDQGRFPGIPAQDPVLLDAEREALGGGLLLSGEVVEENQYALARCLGSLEGKLTLSCSCRDLAEDREIFPSSVLLNAYRLITDDRQGDYQDLERYLDVPAGFVPGEGTVPLNDWEWWFARGGTQLPEEAVLSAYPGLRAGREAEVAREGAVLTVFDGWLPSAEGHLDPGSEGVVLSSSRIEDLAKCPFLFFLKHVLRLEPIEEVERDLFQWLDPMQRGNLLHAVFCRFMERLREEGVQPSLERHRAWIEAMAREEVERWSERVPPATELVKEHEARDILRAVRIFLRDEEAHC
ncbi:MAG: PD-(D/E)XK nuclease family protein, partial [Desulfatiglandaceae bacterium]